MENIAKIIFSHHNTEATVLFSGVWSMAVSQPDVTEVMQELRTQGLYSVRFGVQELGHWDSTLLMTLIRLVHCADHASLKIYKDDLPQDLQHLLGMALAAQKAQTEKSVPQEDGFFAKIGAAVLALPAAYGRALTFLGDVTLSCGRFFRGRADMRGRDFLAAVQECGSEALPIVSVVSLLFGLILAFVGAVQLTQFGAQIYVAGLVGIGMLRVMGAVMVGVVMSGRMGAAYAAFIGTMQVNEEVDALSTFGISPIDFLVLPRMLALTIMTPLLTLYADLMGLAGGFLVGVCMYAWHNTYGVY